MRVLMLSKALVVGAYQRKLELLARERDIDLTCVVPPAWSGRPLETAHLEGYRLVVKPIRFDGSFHFFHFRGLGALMRQVRPDVVHVDEEPYNLATFLALREARRVGAASLFFTWQNLNRTYPPPFRWFESYAFATAAHAIAGSQEAVSVLRAKRYRGPVSVIPQFGVDVEIFRPIERAEPRDAFTIGFAGRLVEEKGLTVLLDSVARLEGEWRLDIVGSGPLESTLRKQASVLRLESQVRFRPHVDSTAMPRVLAGFDVLVAPSLTRPNWKEQFGRVIVEAMACGVPVIGSASGEIPQVIADAGIVIPENDPVALAEAIRSLMTSANLRVELRVLGRQRAVNNFSQRRIAAETAALYRRVAKS